MRRHILRLVLILQGIYYTSTGLWAIIDLEGFSRFISYQVDQPFEMHSIAALSIVLGIAFIYAASEPERNRPLVCVAIGTAIAVIIPEIYYLPRFEQWNLLWLDLIEETIVAILLILTFPQKARPR